VKLRVVLGKFFGCSPTALRDMTGYELRAALEFAEELAKEA